MKKFLALTTLIFATFSVQAAPRRKVFQCKAHKISTENVYGDDFSTDEYPWVIVWEENGQYLLSVGAMPDFNPKNGDQVDLSLDRFPLYRYAFRAKYRGSKDEVQLDVPMPENKVKTARLYFNGASFANLTCEAGY